MFVFMFTYEVAALDTWERERGERERDLELSGVSWMGSQFL